MKGIPICIAGMHRSGTSLTTGYLSICGLYVGEDLLNEKFDNIKGHFEDLDFLKFHQNELARQGLSTTGLHLSVMGLKIKNFSDQNGAILLSQKFENHNVWGWKDPRSTLFLESWKTTIPKLKVLSLHRNPFEVTNSLVSRLKKMLYAGNSPIYTQIKYRILGFYYFKKEAIRYLTAWCIYNETIINYTKKNGKESILFSIEGFKANAIDAVKCINLKFGTDLKEIDFNQFFDKSLVHEIADFKYSIPKKLKLRIERVSNGLLDSQVY